MEVYKVYCDKQSCKKEITKNNICKAVLLLKKPSNYSYDLRDREISISVDLCPDCVEELKGILSKFFNEGCLAWNEMGEEEISTEWNPVDSKF